MRTARWQPASRLGLALALLLGAFLAAHSILGSGTKHGVAYFESVTSVYPHDKIRILGFPVGRIEKITPERNRVRVDFSYDGKYKLPADVKAAVVSPTLVATRFIQLAPAYSSGPTLPDGGEIPIERTASPLEFDDLKSELSRISKVLGPNQADGSSGELARFLTAAARAGKGRGESFNTMVTELSKSLETLSEGRGDIFGTVRNLQYFVTAVAAMDQQVVTFNQRLAGVSDLLADSGPDLARSIKSVDTAARLVKAFVAENRPGLRKSTRQLTSLMQSLASSRDDLATLLHVGPNTLTNFYNIYSPRNASYTGALMVDNLTAPGELVCSLIANQLAQQGKAEQSCNDFIGPVLNQLGVSAPPLGSGGVLVTPESPSEPPAPIGPAGSNEVSGLSSLLGLLIPGGGQ